MNRRYLFSKTDTAKIHLEFAQLFLEMEIPQPKDNSQEIAIQMRITDPARILTCPQPLLYSNIRYNKRHINELWIQLLNAGKYFYNYI